jgi:phage terminase small subunit
MSAGRRPTPTALKIIRGNPGKRAINHAEPKPPAGPLERPEHLDEVAAAEWDRIVPILAAMGVATTADRAAVEAYVILYSEMVATARAGKPLRTGAVAQLRACMSELGLTPAARAKLTTGAAGGDETEERYFGAA